MARTKGSRNKPKGAVEAQAATRVRRNPLQLAVAMSLEFRKAMNELEDYRAKVGMFAEGDFRELDELTVSLAGCVMVSNRESEAIAPQLAMMREKIDMAEQIARLSRELEEANERLRVSGNGRPKRPPLAAVNSDNAA